MPNTELFKKIHDVISVHPELHDQAFFQEGTGCGTTRCVAGWAIHLSHPDDQGQSVSQLVSLFSKASSPSAYARELLDIGYSESDVLFFTLSDEEARRVVAAYAEGHDVLGLCFDAVRRSGVSYYQSLQERHEYLHGV